MLEINKNNSSLIVNPTSSSSLSSSSMPKLLSMQSSSSPAQSTTTTIFLVNNRENELNYDDDNINNNRKFNVLKKLNKTNQEILQLKSNNCGNDNNSAGYTNIINNNNNNNNNSNLTCYSEHYNNMMTTNQQQCSTSITSDDTLDSGTCSDMENTSIIQTSSSSSPPPLPEKKFPSKSKLSHSKSTKLLEKKLLNSKNQNIIEQNNHHTSITIENYSNNNNNNNHCRTGSLTDSDDGSSNESSLLSCDSLNSSITSLSLSSPITSKELNARPRQSILPDSLLRDIRDRKFSIQTTIISSTLSAQNSSLLPSDQLSSSTSSSLLVNKQKNQKTLITIIKNESNDELKHQSQLHKLCVPHNENDTINENEYFKNDRFYKFHINEKQEQENNESLVDENEPKILSDETSFAGFKDLRVLYSTSSASTIDTDTDTSTIRSSKGTVRGVKNRVRNGIATFLQMQQLNVKNYREKDCGKVVLYTTSMGIIRETYAKCSNVKQILRTLLVKFEERDVFMSSEYQQEIRERMQSDEIRVPQLFVEGQYIGDADVVERLNESGDLRKMLKKYKCISATMTCQVCGGYRLLPCPSCNGSKKSVHRNHFTAEFVALKCMNCDEVGLVKCHNC